MSKYLFVFDLDATITKKEILPEIARRIGIEPEMREMTEAAMSGNASFESSFRERVALLQDIPINEIQQIVSEIPLNDLIVNFITQHIELCRIVTGNLDVWIYKLLQNLRMETSFFSSKGIVKNNRLISVSKVIDKGAIVKSLHSAFIAIGDGHNDLPMICASDIGIGFGGVREIAPSVRSAADYNVYTETRLCEILEQFL